MTIRIRNNRYNAVKVKCTCKQQQKQNTYYKKLRAIIKDFTEVVLLGPANAKSELFNFLRQNYLIDGIRIEVINADKMSDNKQHEFVREYFKKVDVKIL